MAVVSFLHGTLEERCRQVELICTSVLEAGELQQGDMDFPLAELLARESTFLWAALKIADKKKIHGRQRLFFLQILSVPGVLRTLADLRKDWQNYPWPQIPLARLKGCGAALRFLTSALIDLDAAIFDQLRRKIPREPRDSAKFQAGSLWLWGFYGDTEPVAYPLHLEERFPTGKLLHPAVQKVNIGPWFPRLKGRGRGVETEWSLELVEFLDQDVGEDQADTLELDLKRKGKNVRIRFDVAENLGFTLFVKIISHHLGARGGVSDELHKREYLRVYLAQTAQRFADGFTDAGYRQLTDKSDTVELNIATRPLVIRGDGRISLGACTGPGGGSQPLHGWDIVPVGTPVLESAMLFTIFLCRAKLGLTAKTLKPNSKDSRKFTSKEAFTRTEWLGVKALTAKFINQVFLRLLKDNHKVLDDVAVIFLKSKFDQMPASQNIHFLNQWVKNFEFPARCASLNQYACRQLSKHLEFGAESKAATGKRYPPKLRLR